MSFIICVASDRLKICHRVLMSLHLIYYLRQELYMPPPAAPILQIACSVRVVTCKVHMKMCLLRC